MIAALIIGKHKSMGCPGKNVRPVLGRPMAEYAFMAAQNSRHIAKVYVSTDSPNIAEIGKKYGAEHIERPPELATPEALTEHALLHAYEEMQARNSERIEIVALLFANAPTIPLGMIDEGIEALQADTNLDSAFSVCQYDMWAPLRARRLDGDGIIQPYVPHEALGDTDSMSSIRGGEGACYFCDLTVQILRDRCFKNMWEGQLPFRWQGQRSIALKNDYGFDIDAQWQIPVVEYWMKEHGFSETRTPYDRNGNG